MASLVAQIIAILTSPPGSLAYHLVIVFSISTCLQTALYPLRLRSDRSIHRLVTGLGVILAAQVILFASAGLAWQNLVSGKLLLPPLERAVTYLCAVVLAWLWVFPKRSPWGDRLAVAFGLLAVLFGAVSAHYWPLYSLSVSFNSSWLDFPWQCLTLAVLITGTAAVCIRRPTGWKTGAWVLGIFAFGTFAQILAPLQSGDLSGSVRLAQLAAYPFLGALAYRPFNTSDGKTIPNPWLQERRKHSTDSRTLKAFLDLAETAHSIPDCLTLTRAFANAMLADCCFLIASPDALGQVTIQGGYDLIQDVEIEGNTMDMQKIPTLAAAIQTGRPLLMSLDSLTAMEMMALSKGTHLGRPGNLLFAPILTPDHPPAGGVLLLTPYTLREWTPEDQVYFSPIAETLARLLFQAAAPEPEPDPPVEREESIAVEVDTASANSTYFDRPPAALNEMNEILTMQDELQKTVERLQYENEQLRQTAADQAQSNLPEGQSFVDPDLQQKIECQVEEVRRALLRAMQAAAGTLPAPGADSEEADNSRAGLDRLQVSLEALIRLLSREILDINDE